MADIRLIPLDYVTYKQFNRSWVLTDNAIQALPSKKHGYAFLNQRLKFKLILAVSSG